MTATIKRNPFQVFRAKYYRAEREGVAFCSPPFTSRFDADNWLERKVREGATGGHIEYAVVDAPADSWYVDPMAE